MADSVLARMAVIFSGDTTRLSQSIKSGEKDLLSLKKTISSVGAALGIGLGVGALISGFKSAAGIMSDFERTMSEVAAITGATGPEFKALGDDALRLGQASKFTATQVGQLQVAYGRLGFTTKEILQASEATIQLATATGEDLAKSADVAGSTVRGFGLTADETQRVVDVMASSFNKTALGLDNFTESMKYVAPVAAAAGASVEETTALLGVLADAGIRGSMAGTSLRKIFTDMTKDGRPLRERLEELGKKGITLADSFDEVGRTAQTSLLILSKNTDKIAGLTAEFQNVAGEAERVSRIMRDNLTGDVEKLSSAFEGLILRLSNSKLFRDLVQGLTGFVNALSGAPAQVDDALDGFAKVIRDTGDQMNRSNPLFKVLVEKLKEVRREAGKPIDTKSVEFFAEKYKLTSDQANVLYQAIIDANVALSFQERVIKKLNDINTTKGYDDLTKAAEDYKNEIYAARLQLQVFQEKAKAVGSANAVSDAQSKLEKYDRELRIINDYLDKLNAKAAANLSGAPDLAFESIDSLQERLKSLREQLEAAPTADIPFLQNLDKQIKDTESRLEYLKMLIDGFQVTDLKYVAPTSDKAINAEDPAELFPYEEIHKQIEAEYEHERAINAVNDAMYAFLTTQEGFAGYSKAYEGMTVDIKKATTDLTPIIQGALSGIGQALGSALSGTQNLGDSLLKVFGGILVQLGEMLITTGLGIEAFTTSLASLDGPLAIAAGIALIAIGSAVSSSISSLGTSAGSGGGNAATSSRTGADNKFDQSDFEIKIGGELRLSGPDLVYVINRQEQLNGRTRG